MQDFSDSQHAEPKRRSSDFVSGIPPSGDTLLQLLRGILNRLEELERVQAESRTAFLINDLGKPDYEGHRGGHRKLVEAERSVQDYKHGATKTVLNWAIGILLGVMLSGFGLWVKEHLK
jgi:hypothetical protein